MKKVKSQINATMINDVVSLQPWIVVLSSATFFFLIFVQINIFNAINPYLIQDLGFNTTQLGVLSACYFVANTIFVIPAGMVLDRFSVKKNLLLALAVTSLCTYVFASAHSFAIMAIMRLLIGLVGSFCFVSCIKLATRWFPPHRMALIAGLITTMAMLGGMVAQTPLTLLVDNYGWRTGLFATVALGILFFFLVAAAVRDYPRGMKEKLLKQQTNLSTMGFWFSLGKTLANMQNWLAGTYISLINLPIFMLGATWGSMYLVQAGHLTRAQSSLVVSMMFIGMIVGSPLIGWFSDKIRERKRPKIFGALFSIATLLAIIYLPNLSFASLLTLFFVLGFMVSTQVLGYPLITESNPPALAATATSIGSTLIVAGGMLTPVFGWLMGLYWNHAIVDNIPLYSRSDYRLAMMILLVAFVISLIISMLIKETHCRQMED